jgi:hypothetical protein
MFLNSGVLGRKKTAAATTAIPINRNLQKILFFIYPPQIELI